MWKMNQNNNVCNLALAENLASYNLILLLFHTLNFIILVNILLLFYYSFYNNTNMRIMSREL